MNEQEKQRVRQWMHNWQMPGPMLERLYNETIRNANAASEIEALSDICVSDSHNQRIQKFAPAGSR